jgi:hypothetical protein
LPSVRCMPEGPHFVATIERGQPALSESFTRQLSSCYHLQISLDVPPDPSDECDHRGRAAGKEHQMKAFTIDTENNITVHASVKAAPKTEGIEVFASEKALAELAAAWPAGRLVDIWNSLAGATPVKKFANRGAAVTRIWTGIQTLGGAETPQTPDVAPAEAPANKKATRGKNAPKPAVNASVPRERSKTSQVIAMLKREGGTTLEEIMTAMGWQKHTTRALLSAGGSLTKNHGLVVTSEKVGDKRTYSIKP